MKAKVKSIIRILAFIFVLASLLFSINNVLVPKYYLSNSTWPTTSTYQTFYSMKRDSIDVLFFGSSYGVNGFIPLEIYKQYGIRSYNLCSEQQSVFLSYYWLKEALRYQRPSVVVLEGRFLRSWHSENPVNTTEGLIRKCLDPMRLSPVKIEAINELCNIDKTQIKSSWYLTNIRFHNRWKSLNEIDFCNTMHSQLMGWAPGNGGLLNEYSPFVDLDNEEVIELDQLMIEYFEKMAELCKQNGIRFVVVNVPSNGFRPAVYHAYKNLCQKYNVDYYELAKKEVWEEMGIELPHDNPVGHGNIWGNIKVSRYVGTLLKKIYNISQVIDPQYEDGRYFYEHIVTRCRLHEVMDIDEYLSLLNDSDLMLFISVKDEASKALRDSTKRCLQDLGFKKEWNAETDFRKGYIGVKTDEGVTEETGTKIKISGRFRNKNNSYEITSSGNKTEGVINSSIILDGKEQAVNSRGLNIVVYDAVLHRVIDSVAFDTYCDSAPKRK